MSATTGQPDVVAAFDFDGTLTDGGSVWRFLAAVAGWPAVLRATVPLVPRIAVAALVGGEQADTTKERLFRAVLAGLPADIIGKRAESFGLSHFERHARPEMVARLQDHLRAGHRVAIVSASPEIYLRPVADRLGAHTVIATRLAVDGDGRLTGGYDGANCRGAQKAQRLIAWAAEATGTSRQGPGAARDGAAGTIAIWAYGNSAGDLAMLRVATVAVGVGRLGRLGRLRGFPTLRDAPRPVGNPAVAPPGAPGAHQARAAADG